MKSTRRFQSRGWNRDRQAFVQHYGSDSLDASNLLMPLVFFMSPTDPRMLSTIDAINRSPQQGGLVSDSLVYRYNHEQFADGLTGHEGTFNMCTFWLVEAPHPAAGWGDPPTARPGPPHVRENAGLRQPPGLVR